MGDRTDEIDQRERSALYDLLLPSRATVLVEIETAATGIAYQPRGAFARHLKCRLATADPEPGAVDVMTAAPGALPFAASSVDCMLVPGSLDGAGLASGRAALLAEAHRTLAPGGTLVLHAGNALDLRGAILWLLRLSGHRRRVVGRGARRASYRGWRTLVRHAGFAEAAFYAVALRPTGGLALVSMSPAAAAAHYRYEFPPPFSPGGTTMSRLSWLFARLNLMRFLEPSFIVFARK